MPPSITEFLNEIHRSGKHGTLSLGEYNIDEAEWAVIRDAEAAGLITVHVQTMDFDVYHFTLTDQARKQYLLPADTARREFSITKLVQSLFGRPAN